MVMFAMNVNMVTLSLKRYVLKHVVIDVMGVMIKILRYVFNALQILKDCPSVINVKVENMVMDVKIVIYPVKNVLVLMIINVVNVDI